MEHKVFEFERLFKYNQGSFANDVSLEMGFFMTLADLLCREEFI